MNMKQVRLAIATLALIVGVGCNKNSGPSYTTLATPGTINYNSTGVAPVGYCSAIVAVNQASVYENNSNQGAGTTDGDYNDSDLSVSVDQYNVYDEANASWTFFNPSDPSLSASAAYTTIQAPSYSDWASNALGSTGQVEFDLPYNLGVGGWPFLMGTTNFDARLSFTVYNLKHTVWSDTESIQITPARGSDQGQCGVMVTYVITNSGNTTHFNGNLRQAPGHHDIKLNIGEPIVYNVKKDVMASYGVTKESLNGMAKGSLKPLATTSQINAEVYNRTTALKAMVAQSIEKARTQKLSAIKAALGSEFYRQLARPDSTMASAVVTADIVTEARRKGYYTPSLQIALDQLAKALR